MITINVYVCKAFRGSQLKGIKYIQAISPKYALYEFKNEFDLDEQQHLYFEVRQVD